MSRQDRRDGQRHGSSGQPMDPARFTDPDYRQGYQGGRSARVNRELTGHGQDDAESRYRQARAEADAAHAQAAEAARAKTGGNLVRQAAMQAADAQRRLDYQAAADEYMRS